MGSVSAEMSFVHKYAEKPAINLLFYLFVCSIILLQFICSVLDGTTKPNKN